MTMGKMKKKTKMKKQGSRLTLNKSLMIKHRTITNKDKRLLNDSLVSSHKAKSRKELTNSKEKGGWYKTIKEETNLIRMIRTSS